MAKIVVFTGMPGSGKSEALKVAEELGIPVFRMGAYVWEEVEARGLEIKPVNVRKIAHEMRQTHGPGIWAERTIERIKKEAPPKSIIIDGSRSREEIAAFRDEWGEDLVIIAIHASPGTRHARLLARGRADDTVTEESVKERDAQELGWGLGEVIGLADTVIINEGTVDELRADIREILREFL